MIISNDDTELPLRNITRWFRNSHDVVWFVEDYFDTLENDPVLTITIRPGKYAGFYVCIATTVLLDDTLMPGYLDEQRII